MDQTVIVLNKMATLPKIIISIELYMYQINVFYYTSQYFSLQASLFCWNKIFSFCSEANVLGVVKNLFSLLGAKKRFFTTTKRDYHVTCQIVR